MAGDITLTAAKCRPVGEFYLSLNGTAYEALTLGALVILDPTAATWKKANAGSAAGVKGTIGLVIGGASGTHYADGTIASGDVISVLTHGYVELGSDQALALDKVLYASATAGKMTDVAPANFRKIATPLTTTIIYFNPSTSEPGS